MNVLCPTSLREALGMLAEEPDAIPLAGGTDLLVHWPAHHKAREATYLDLGRITDLRQHRWTDDALILGATTTYWDMIRDPRTTSELPLLVDAARQVGAVQIQARGTWAGNIANASPAADGVPVLMAYDAVVVVQSERDCCEIPLADFYLGYKEMRLADDQLIKEIRVPIAHRTNQRFDKVGSRRAQAIAKVGLATVRAEDGWRVVAASLAPTVCRCPTVESLLDSGETAVAASALGEFEAALAADVSPIDDIRSTADYRKRVAARLLFFGPGGHAA